MTVSQLLRNIDSRELSEWYVLSDLEFWQKRLASKQQGPRLSGDNVVQFLFPKAANQGGIQWRHAHKKS